MKTWFDFAALNYLQVTGNALHQTLIKLNNRFTNFKCFSTIISKIQQGVLNLCNRSCRCRH